MILKDLTGKRFGRLTVLSRAPDRVQNSGRHRVMWNCVCDCGNKRVVYGDNLKKGVTQSCGCYQKELQSAKQKTHGETETKLYAVWCSMKARCFRDTTTHYKYYGGRGITVCNEWVSSYEAFREWSYENGYYENDNRECTLDRIDVNGDYCPSNCRWVADVAQANNRRSNRIYAYNGEEHNVTEWAHIIGIDPKTLFSRIYSGMDFEKAINKK